MLSIYLILFHDASSDPHLRITHLTLHSSTPSHIDTWTWQHFLITKPPYKRPCKIHCTFYCHWFEKNIAIFFVFWTPTLRLKITKIDPALRLLVLVFSFSPCYCGICPKKLVKWYFVGAVNSSTNEIYPLNLKGMDHKLMCSEIPGQLAFRWLNWRKNCFAPK